eukprot:658328-Prymnesium_polylepis.2
MQPALDHQCTVSIVKAHTLVLHPLARRQREGLLAIDRLNARAVARIPKLKEPVVAWPEVDLLLGGPELTHLDTAPLARLGLGQLLLADLGEPLLPLPLAIARPHGELVLLPDGQLGV